MVEIVVEMLGSDATEKAGTRVVGSEKEVWSERAGMEGVENESEEV